MESEKQKENTNENDRMESTSEFDSSPETNDNETKNNDTTTTTNENAPTTSSNQSNTEEKSPPIAHESDTMRAVLGGLTPRMIESFGGVLKKIQHKRRPIPRDLNFILSMVSIECNKEKANACAINGGTALPICVFTAVGGP